MAMPEPESHSTAQSSFRPQPRRTESPASLPAEFASPFVDAACVPPPTLPPADKPVVAELKSSCLGSLLRSLLWVALLSCIGALWFYWRSSPQDSLEGALKLVGRGDYAAAYPLLQEAAAAGLPPAYIPLAHCYAQGKGTAINNEQARFWYNRAELGGAPSATLALADMDFVAGDYASAAKRYAQVEHLLSAEQLFRCARCYHLRVPAVPSNNSADEQMQSAVRYYQLAAAKGNTAAALELGTCYYKGVGTPSSIGAAVKWFSQAAEQGNAEAQFRLAWCLLESGSERESEAVQWLLRSAEQGNIPACYDLAVCYLNGSGVTASPQKAVLWLKKAAELQHPAALRRLAFCYRDGVGLPQNLPQAVQYFALAAEAGDAEAQFNYAWCLHRGYGVQQNLPAALVLYHRAALQGFPPAQDALNSLFTMRFLPENVILLLEKSQNYPKM